jgi:AcrR family transcriptional regulator
MSRKNEIIEAVITILQEKGFSQEFTMSEIARKMDMGKSTIYEYFGNKDDLHKEAVKYYLSQKISLLQSGIDTDAMDFETLFKTQLRMILEVATESRTVLEALSPGFIQRFPESVREDMKQSMEVTRKRLEERFISYFMMASEEGLISKDFDVAKGLTVMSMVVGAVLVYSDATINIDIDDFIQTIYDSILLILN